PSLPLWAYAELPAKLPRVRTNVSIKRVCFMLGKTKELLRGALPTRSLSPVTVARSPQSTPCRMPQGSRSSLHLVVTCSASCPLVPPERAHIPKNSDSMQIGSEEVRFQNQTGRPDLESVVVKEC